MARMHGGVATVFLLAAGLRAPAAHAQTPSPSPVPDRAQKSVRGALQSIDKNKGDVVMTADDGKQVAWRFSAPVLTEVAKVPAGAPMVVIYRQTAANEKRVTAIAFPGTAAKPTYVNLTGASVVLRSGPIVGDSCGTADAGPVTESAIPDGGRAEVLDACWCCAPAGGTCTPGNRSGQGQALLERCFE
jgi:hypothetical protein